jgi:hypothetical protein
MTRENAVNIQLDKMWPMEKRIQTRRWIEAEAKRAAARLGAHTVLIIASFTDSDGCINLLDGGTVPHADTFRRYLRAMETLEANGGADTLAVID